MSRGENPKSIFLQFPKTIHKGLEFPEMTMLHAGVDQLVRSFALHAKGREIETLHLYAVFVRTASTLSAHQRPPLRTTIEIPIHSSEKVTNAPQHPSKPDITFIAFQSWKHAHFA